MDKLTLLEVFLIFAEIIGIFPELFIARNRRPVTLVMGGMLRK